jgi:hypothetical protein
MLNTFKARDLQPVPIDVLNESRTGQQRDRVPAGAQHTAHEAADATGACDRNGLQCPHIANHSLYQPVGISLPVTFSGPDRRNPVTSLPLLHPMLKYD